MLKSKTKIVLVLPLLNVKLRKISIKFRIFLNSSDAGAGNYQQSRSFFCRSRSLHSTIAHFNIDGKATVEVLQALGINPGTFCIAGLNQSDQLCVNMADYKAEDTNKTRSAEVKEKTKETKMMKRRGKPIKQGHFKWYLT